MIVQAMVNMLKQQITAFNAKYGQSKLQAIIFVGGPQRKSIYISTVENDVLRVLKVTWVTT